jgi:hypothetical protein
MAQTPAQIDRSTQDPTTYFAQNDANYAALARLAIMFAPHEQATPDMTVRVEAGAVWTASGLTEVSAQDSDTIIAPSSNPRIDRIVLDPLSGLISVVTGDEGTAPSAPAISTGKLPVAQVSLAVGQTSIVNSGITDERTVAWPALPLRVSQGGTGATTAAGARTNLGAEPADATIIKEADIGTKVLAPDGDGSGLTGIDSVPDWVRQSTSINTMWRLAEQGKSYFSLANVLIDEFEDESGIDTGSSSGQTYDSVNDLYSPTMTYGTTTLCSGGTPSVSSVYAGQASNVFDGSAATYWVSNTTSAPWWVQYAFASAVIVRKYEVTDWYTASNAPTNWQFQGSNDAGATWDTLDTQTGMGAAAVSGSSRAFEIENNTAYTSYRLYITANYNATTQTGVAEIKMFDGTLDDMHLVSASVSAAEVPDTMIIMVRTGLTDTVNTDYMVDVSRDGGTTWTTVALESIFVENAHTYFEGAAIVSAQPTGASLKYRVRTDNGVDADVKAVAMSW